VVMLAQVGGGSREGDSARWHRQAGRQAGRHSETSFLHTAGSAPLLPGLLCALWRGVLVRVLGPCWRPSNVPCLSAFPPVQDSFYKSLTAEDRANLKGACSAVLPCPGVSCPAVFAKWMRRKHACHSAAAGWVFLEAAWWARTSTSPAPCSFLTCTAHRAPTRPVPALPCRVQL